MGNCKISFHPKYKKFYAYKEKKVDVFERNRSQSAATYLGAKEVVLGLILESTFKAYTNIFKQVGRFFIKIKFSTDF